MRKLKWIKIFAGISLVTGYVLMSSSPAFGVTSMEVDHKPLINLSGSIARASTDIRVRRLKQMFSNNQISADEFFVRAQGSDEVSPSNAKPSVE